MTNKFTPFLSCRFIFLTWPTELYELLYSAVTHLAPRQEIGSTWMSHPNVYRSKHKPNLHFIS